MKRLFLGATLLLLAVGWFCFSRPSAVHAAGCSNPHPFTISAFGKADVPAIAGCTISITGVDATASQHDSVDREAQVITWSGVCNQGINQLGWASLATNGYNPYAHYQSPTVSDGFTLTGALGGEVCAEITGSDYNSPANALSVTLSGKYQ